MGGTVVIRGFEVERSVLEPPPTPWPAPPEAPVLLFGGTFDPPHRAHATLAGRARDRLLGEPGWLVYVPAARSPHKDRGPVASDADRLEMLRLATADLPRTAIWTDEIDRAGAGAASYWVDTLARAASLLPDPTPLRFLIGADQALAFDRWRAHEMILALGEPAVLLREPCTTPEALRRELRARGQDAEAWLGRLALPDDVVPGASTDVRAMLEAGGDASGLLDPRVLGHIRQRGLYGAR